MRIINQVTQLPVTVNANVSTAQIFPQKGSTLLPSILIVPGSSRFEQKRFVVRASGYIITAATLNVTLTLYTGTSLTPGSDVSLSASTATAQNSATAPFSLEAYLICDSVSGKLHGTAKFLINDTVTAEAAVTAGTGFNMASEPAINLVLGVTFSVANAGNSAILNEFSMGF